MCAPGELEVLLVEKELFGEAAEFAEDVATDRQGRAARVGDVLRIRELVGRIAVAAGPREPAYVHDVAARVQELGLLQEADSGLHDADVRVFEGTRQCSEGTRSHDRIRVEEDDDLRVHLTGAS